MLRVGRTKGSHTLPRSWIDRELAGIDIRDGPSVVQNYHDAQNALEPLGEGHFVLIPLHLGRPGDEPVMEGVVAQRFYLNPPLVGRHVKRRLADSAPGMDPSDRTIAGKLAQILHQV